MIFATNYVKVCIEVIIMRDNTIDLQVFAKRLSALMESSNETTYSLAEKLSLTPATISRYANGLMKPKVPTVVSMAEIFGVNDTWLMGYNVPKELNKYHHSIKIPVLGYVRAGVPIDAVEEILDYEEITEEMARSGSYFCLKIKGDSMEPKFSEGDVVVIRQQETVENGDIAVVLINGDDATIKKFYKSDAGVQLVATNPTYPPLLFTPQEVNNLPVSIIGKAVELRAKL